MDISNSINTNFKKAKKEIEEVKKNSSSVEDLQNLTDVVNNLTDSLKNQTTPFIFNNMTAKSGVEAFKALFPRFSPDYLPVWEEGRTYFENDEVYYNDLFYICIVENTTAEPTNNAAWKLTADSVYNYTRDEDIENAMLEASVNFPSKALISDENKRKLIFLYLVAHYLTIDFRNALGSNQVGILTSKSVGSVSESYSLPPYLNNRPALSAYTTTGYGIKYATLIAPYLCGAVFIAKGRTTNA